MRRASFETEPKSHQVRKVLLESLFSGEFKAGQQLPTENEMTDRFRVSRATIREAVSSLVHEGWLTRVQGKGTFVAEKPLNKLSIAVVMPYLYFTDQAEFLSGTDVIPRLVQAIEGECRKSKSNIFLMLANQEIPLERENLIRVLESDIDAIILNYIGGEENRDCLETIRTKRIPLVLIDRYLDDFLCDYVVTDNNRGSQTAVAQLDAAGFDNIWYITQTPDNSALRDRQEGYQQAMTQRGYIPRILSLEDAIDQVSRTEERVALFTSDATQCAALWNVLQRFPDRYRQIALACFDETFLSFPRGVTVVKILQPLHDIGQLSIQFATEQVAAYRTGRPEERRTFRQIRLQPVVHVCSERTDWTFHEVPVGIG
jgi:DNA-binding LacI/PurR family transcriptional regulator